MNKLHVDVQIEKLTGRSNHSAQSAQAAEKQEASLVEESQPLIKQNTYQQKVEEPKGRKSIYYTGPQMENRQMKMIAKHDSAPEFDENDFDEIQKIGSDSPDVPTTSLAEKAVTNQVVEVYNASSND